MATTRSSRAITSTDAPRRPRRPGLLAPLAVLGGLAVVSAAPTLSTTASAVAPDGPAPAPRAAAQPPPQGQGSFFDPLDRIDPRRWYVADGWVNGDHQGCTWSRDNVRVAKGVLRLHLGKAADRLRPYRCAELQTVGAYGYGAYEVRMRTAAGSGLNSAIFTYSGKPVSPVHDEIDFEFLGKNSGRVQLNYFTGGKGGHETTPDLGFDASAGFNDYAFVWGPGGIRWYVNGKLVREASGPGLPSTPGKFYLTLWNGSQTVNDWLGPFDAGRTPALAEVEWAAFTRAGERCLFPQSVTCKLP